MARLLHHTPEQPESPEDEGDADPWRIGDLVTHEVLARLYAAYLEPQA